MEEERGGEEFPFEKVGAIWWTVFASSPRSTTPPLQIHCYNIFLTHWESQTQRWASLRWLFSYSPHTVASFSPSSWSHPAPTKRVFDAFSARYSSTWMNERQQYHYNTNLPIWSVAIETKVLVALVEHVSASVLEINNLRYGLCQAGASERIQYVCTC